MPLSSPFFSLLCCCVVTAAVAVGALAASPSTSDILKANYRASALPIEEYFTKDEDGSVEGTYTSTAGTLAQCYKNCFDGTWKGCKGFSRYMAAADDDATATCWWAGEYGNLLTDDGNNNEHMYRLLPSAFDDFYETDHDGSVGGTYTKYIGTIAECYRYCLDGTWPGCRGFSRYISSDDHSDKECWWVGDQGNLIYDDGNSNEHLYRLLPSSVDLVAKLNNFALSSEVTGGLNTHYTKDEVNGLLNTHYTKDEVNGLLNTHYTKDEVNGLIDEAVEKAVEQALRGVDSKCKSLDTNLGNKRRSAGCLGPEPAASSGSDGSSTGIIIGGAGAACVVIAIVVAVVLVRKKGNDGFQNNNPSNVQPTHFTNPIYANDDESGGEPTTLNVNNTGGSLYDDVDAQPTEISGDSLYDDFDEEGSYLDVEGNQN